MIYSFRFWLPRPLLHAVLTDMRAILVLAVLIAALVIWSSQGTGMQTTSFRGYVT